MPISDAFVTPAKGAQPRKKIRHAAKPTTFGTVTQSLIKRFRDASTSIKAPSISVASFPDFSNVPLPDDLNTAERNRVIRQMTVAYAANLASNAAQSTTPKISIRDIESQRSYDVKPIPTAIEDSIDSFLQGLFQFRRVREQLRGWTSATYMVLQTATTTDIASDDDDDEDNANKWSTTTIDLFKDFEKIRLSTMHEWAESIWTAEDATLKASDGESETYARRAFSEFIFASVASELQKSIQNSITNSRLWNDGPLVWAVLIHHFFPSPVALKVTILDKMKSTTLAQHRNDLKLYCAAMMDMNAVVDTSPHTEELITVFLTQVNTHPSDIVRNHFNHIGLDFFMHPDKPQSLSKLLETADHLHTVTSSPSLPFAVSSNSNRKIEQNIAALAGVVQSNMGSLKKVIAHLGQLDNNVKQGFKATKTANKNSRVRGGNTRPTPPWINDAPMNPYDTKEFNNKTWYYCATCGRWSTTHSTNGFVHQGKTIAKHQGQSRSKRSPDTRDSPNDKSSNDRSNKKQKPSPAIEGLQSLKAEITKQSKSSVFELFKAAAQEK